MEDSDALVLPADIIGIVFRSYLQELKQRGRTPDEIRAARRCIDAYFLCIEFASRMTYLPARSTRTLSPDADPGNAWDDVVRWYEQEQ